MHTRCVQQEDPRERSDGSTSGRGRWVQHELSGSVERLPGEVGTTLSGALFVAAPVRAPIDCPDALKRRVRICGCDRTAWPVHCRTRPAADYQSPSPSQQPDRTRSAPTPSSSRRKPHFACESLPDKESARSFCDLSARPRVQTAGARPVRGGSSTATTSPLSPETRDTWSQIRNVKSKVGRARETPRKPTTETGTGRAESCEISRTRNK
eukprot:5416377-Pleurochrysis_carterae.AAC.1